ncbi:MAG: hypothetical protein AAF211_27455, partial [Myxococcota bacterium]
AALSPPVDPVMAGLRVDRTYEPLDDPADVARRADGTWEVQAGARVSVQISVTVPDDRQHVAISDALPAGFEPVRKASSWGLGYATVRDDGATAFATWLSRGTHTLTYEVRAVNLGRFTAPPATAEEMYRPETFGRSIAETVVVVPL